MSINQPGLIWKVFSSTVVDNVYQCELRHFYQDPVMPKRFYSFPHSPLFQNLEVRRSKNVMLFRCIDRLILRLSCCEKFGSVVNSYVYNVSDKTGSWKPVMSKNIITRPAVWGYFLTPNCCANLFFSVRSSSNDIPIFGCCRSEQSLRSIFKHLRSRFKMPRNYWLRNFRVPPFVGFSSRFLRNRIACLF